MITECPSCGLTFGRTNPGGRSRHPSACRLSAAGLTLSWRHCGARASASSGLKRAAMPIAISTWWEPDVVFKFVRTTTVIRSSGS